MSGAPSEYEDKVIELLTYCKNHLAKLAVQSEMQLELGRKQVELLTKIADNTRPVPNRSSSYQTR